MPPAITFEKISRTFGEYTAVDGIDLEIAAGKFIAVVGPSGCGKSTLLNMAAGLIAPTRGEVSIFGEPLNGLNRRAAYMFQQDALLPWKTVLENVGLGTHDLAWVRHLRQVAVRRKCCMDSLRRSARSCW